MKLKTKFLILMLLILMSFTAVAWLYSEHSMSRINEQWAEQQAERQVQFDKHRTLLPLIREINLARQLAAEPAIINMALNEGSPDVNRLAIEVLERYRNNFRSLSYFAAFAKTGHLYTNDATNQFKANPLRYTLSKAEPDDSWFFASLANSADYNVNVDHNAVLGVTKVWINVTIKQGSKVLGVIGTGIDLTEFLKETVATAQPGIQNLFINREMAIQIHTNAKLINYPSAFKPSTQQIKLSVLLKNTADIENLTQVMRRLEVSNKKVEMLWVDFEGEKQLLGVAYLPELGWFDLTLMNSKKFSPLGDINNLPLLLGLFFLMALLMVWFALHYWVLSPIAKLQSAMDKIGYGEFDTNPPLVGTGEILQLSIKFKKMFEFVRKTNLGLEESVKQRTQLLQAILDNAPLGIWMADVMGKIQFVNKTFCNATGISEQTFLQVNHYAEVLPPTNATSCRLSDQECITQLEGPHFSTEWMLFVDGKDHLLEITKVKLLNQDGSVKGIVGLAADITERKQAEARLQLAASVFTHAREGILITDALGSIIEVNDTFTTISGYSREEVLGQNPRIFHSRRQSPEFYTEMWKALLQKGHWYGELWNRHKNGNEYAVSATISQVRDAKGVVQSYVELFTDITETKKHQQQLEHIAHYDVLTNLPNRVLLADRLKQAILHSQRQNKSLVVAFLDLDGFKDVNDQYGHDTGDRLLVSLAHRMKDALREGDTLARIGGDEFVAVLVDLTQVQDCEPVLARLLQATSSQVIIGDAVLQVSASIGVTFYPQDGSDADLLIRHADQAMYAAKLAGKNRYHIFDVDQDVAIKTQRESLDHIRTALEQREFVLYYQPKVNMKTGALIGAEALIRWQHPERGLLPPVIFLPVIENHQLSIEIGDWVINTALAQISQWQALGLNIPVSVNIGALQLQQDNFVTRLAEHLAAHQDVDPGNLELEILETSALEDITKVSELMHACRALGVRFALDDFGTGYSSLTYLKHLPAHILKIDQSFVRDMTEDPDDHAIVEAVVGLAKAFQREVIAEGVETIAHGTLLLTLGCVLAQGYGIARPMPAKEIPEWAANWKPDISWSVGT